ncbi:MAG: sensor histidine kinase [Ilyomonas sp.]
MDRFYLLIYSFAAVLLIIPLLVSKPLAWHSCFANGFAAICPTRSDFFRTNERFIKIIVQGFKKNIAANFKKCIKKNRQHGLYNASLLLLLPKKQAAMMFVFKTAAEISIPTLILLETQTLWYILLAINILSGIAILLYMRNAYIRKKENLTYTNKLLEMEAKALSSQMNPHFIYNSLCTVQHLILINENQKAFDYISDFSLLMRQMLNNSRKSYVALEDEIDFLNRYLQLEKFRFSNSFNYRIQVDEALKVNGHCIPPMIIQPIIENAIKHGLAPKKEKDNALLKIELSLHDDILECVVDDNGMGWKKTQPTFSSAKYESTALNIIRERLKLIRSYNNNTGRLEIIDKYSNGYKESGTTVKIYMPIVNTL